MGGVPMDSGGKGAAASTITADMLKDLAPTVSANAEVLVPVGITIMAIMVGVSLIPRILYKFL